MTPLLAIACLVSVTVALLLWRRDRALKREAHIRSFTLPNGLFERLRQHHPQLTQKDCQLVAHGLRQFFLAYLKSGRRFVSMPSQVVDDLWHEFILYTKAYQVFCRQAFGGFLHHTPAAVLGGEKRSNAGLRRCWWQVCRDENINPRAPSRLPLLFALDTKLGIANGFHYKADCGGLRRRGDGAGVGSTHCGTDFSSDSYDGGTAGFGDGAGGEGSSDGSGGDGGSDGGSSCGGGGCGGGGGD